MAELNSPGLTFTCDPERGTFSLYPLGPCPRPVENARIELVYRSGGRQYRFLKNSWQTFAPGAAGSVIESPHGLQRCLVIYCGADQQGVTASIEFRLAEESPLLFWRVMIHNRSGRPVFIDRILLLEAGERFGGRVGLEDTAPGQAAFYSNGWQSWNYSAAYSGGEAQRRTNLGFLEAPMYINPATPQTRKAGEVSADFFGVIGDREGRCGWLAGMLSEKQHFASLHGLLEPPLGLRLWAAGDGAQLDPEERISTDWAVLQPVGLDDPEPLLPYLLAAARENTVPAARSVPAGWCSWYQYYQNLSAADVRANLAALAHLRRDLPLDLVQIDDGFEAQIGSWFDFQPAFPQGVAALAAEIAEQGYQPGLWLAPFIVHPRSRLAREHPELLLRGKGGRPVSSGFNWNAITWALDLTRPEAVDFAAQVIRTAVQEWGFPYLKLDFLYAGGLSGNPHNPRLTRAQALRGGLEALREAAGPQTFLLGCGVPLGPALGLFDAMRIGADVSGQWEPEWMRIKPFFRREPHMPSVRNALQNTITRAMLHRHWWTNDPDCLLVRPDSRLTLAEVQSLAAAVALTGGSLILSDDLTSLPAERLKIAQALLPVTGRRCRVIDWFDRQTPERLRLDLSSPAGAWSLLAWFNWQDHPVDFDLHPEAYGLPRGSYSFCSFWDETVGICSPGEARHFAAVPAHGCVLAAVRPVGPGAAYLGGSLHISQGLEIERWDEQPGGLKAGFRLPRRAEGSVFVQILRPTFTASLGSQPLLPEQVLPGCYRFALQFEGQAELTIDWG